MSGILELRDKVQRILTEVFRDVRIDKDGDFAIPYASTIVWVRCFEQSLKDENSRLLISVTSSVLSKVDPSPDLFEFVATHSDDWLFGHLTATKNDATGQCAIWMRHTLLGDYLDSEELKSAVIGICVSADTLDDQMKERFGGERYFED